MNAPAMWLSRNARGRPQGSALVVALMTLALAGTAAAALAELGRMALVRTRLDRDGVRSWFIAEAGLADTVAAIAPGADFTEHLTPLAPAPPDPVPWTYVADLRDDADESPNNPAVDSNRRVLLRITASGPPPVRRRLEAVVGRALDPLFPAAATLAGGVRELTGDLLLDGRDAAMSSTCTMGASGRAKAGLALPEGAALPAIDHPERITGVGAQPSIARVPAPDLGTLADDRGATHRPAGPLAGGLGSTAAPQFTVVDGDASVDSAMTGGGVLYVAGRLRVGGTFAFTGVLAVAGGVELTDAGTLFVCGALWAGGEPALDARGRGAIRTSNDAIRWAAGVAPLPAHARVIAVRELF